ncbi:MAG: RNA polymerase sigma factor [Candidatus Eisenbacteria bacterium]|nr:RNA polymerase sigma factor [Candidatus Eisenbacteria bacterium]
MTPRYRKQAGPQDAAASPAAESALLVRLREGDEAAFASLVDRLHGRLRAMARTIVRTDAVAEEAVQETWLAVIRGIRAFEGRSTLSTWVFSILVNRARTIAVREKRAAEVEGRPVPPSPAASADPEDSEGDGDEPGMGANGHWEQPPASWGLIDPESEMLGRETLAIVEQALGDLPEPQQLAVRLCDVEGLPPGDVCAILEVSEANRRVLLHRGRARVRRALDAYMKEGLRPGTPVVKEKRP